MYLDGPYGAPAVNLHGGGVKCVLLLSSGMGWTALRAWKRQLLQDAVRGRAVKVVQSVAVLDHECRDQLAEFQGWEGELAGQSLPDSLCLVVRSWAALCAPHVALLATAGHNCQ